jgi:23S rRNA (cytosine1962-C5)-methyltransferase
MDEVPSNFSRERADQSQRSKPWAQLRFVTFQPHIFPRMLGQVSPDAKAGDLVAVYDKNGQRIGAGL